MEFEQAREKAEGWARQSIPDEFHWLRQYAVNAKHAVELPREALLSAASELGEIDLYADNPDFFSWAVELRITAEGVMHGLAGWFECELAEGVWMTNSPLADRRINRSQAFLPIDEAVPVKAGRSGQSNSHGPTGRPPDRLGRGVSQPPDNASATRPGRGCCWHRKT